MGGLLGIMAAKYVLLDHSPSDVLWATIAALDGDFTVYAPGYREANFLQLRVGMTSAEVEAIVGPPLHVGQWQDAPAGLPIVPGADPLEPYWSYTRAGKPNLGSYWLRQVWFRGQTVVRIVDNFYLD